MKYINFIKKHKTMTLLIAISLIVLIILLQNTDYVIIRILFWRISAHKILFILAAMVLGYIIGKLVEIPLKKRG